MEGPESPDTIGEPIPEAPTPASETPETAAREERGRRPWIRWALAALGMLAPVVLTLGIFLAPYASGRTVTPVGGDTPWYIARQRVVAAAGLDALEGGTAAGPKPPKPLADRPAYPLIGSMLAAATATDPFDLMYVLPAVIAACVALVAGAFALEILDEPSWAYPVYALAVGVSVEIARTTVMSHDNLLADLVLLAGGTVALLAADRRATRAAAIVLLAGGAITHWRFAVPFLLLLLALDALLIPDLIRRRRAGERLRDTPAGRLGQVIGGAVLAGVGALWFGPSLPTEPPKVKADRIAKLTQQWMPQLRLSVTGAAAALGAIALWWPKSDRRRWGLAVMAMWAASVPLSTVLSSAIGTRIPIYRVTAFALGIPFLGAALVVGIARLAGRLGSIGVILGSLLVVAGLAGSMWIANDLWRSQEASIPRERAQELAASVAYMQQTGAAHPVIFVVERGKSTTPARAMRAMMPLDLVRHAYIYLGPPENLLEGRPTTLPDDKKYNVYSMKWWRAIQPILGNDPVILRLDSFAGGVSTALGSEIAPGVTVVSGPPATIAAATPFEGPSTWWLAGRAALLLLLLLGVGLGWTVGLVPRSWVTRASLAPAFGFATLGLAGLVADRLGLLLHGTTAVIVLAATAIAGWGPVAVRAARRRSRGEAAREGSMTPA